MLVKELICDGASAEHPPLTGWVTTELARYLVELRYATKFSLWAVFDEPIWGMAVRDLEVTVAGSSVCLGPCLTLSYEDDARVVWLAPTDVHHDLDLLFSKAEVHVLGMDLSVLPLSDDYLDGIAPSFRSSISDLTCELNGYMANLDSLDKQCQDESPLVCSSIKANLIGPTARALNRSLDAWNAELARFTKGLSPEEREHYGFYFRRHMWSILVRAPFLAPMNVQAQKDSPVHEIQRLLTDDREEANTFGKSLRNYFCGKTPSSAVDSARQECSQMLLERLHKHDAVRKSKFKVLSVVCGPALEWVDSLRTPEIYENVILSLLDFDSEVLRSVASHINQAQRTVGTTLAVEYIEASRHRMLEAPALVEPGRQFDFIYSLSLLDYLSDSTARTVIQKLYQLLAPQGDLVLVNVTSDGSTGLLEEYWKDLKPHGRSESEFMALISPLTDADASLRYDTTKLEMLLRVSKNDLPETVTEFEGLDIWFD